MSVMMSGIFSTTSVAAMVAIFLVIGSFIQIMQRRLFHPLHLVPGPWINRPSELPATLALVSGNQHIYYRWLHERYGPVVRVSPDELSFISVDAREEIYGLRKGGLNMEKSAIFLGAVGNVDGQTGVSLALNEEHTRQRRALGHLFTNSALLQQETILRLHVRKLITVLKEMAAKTQPVDFSSWYTYIAFDVIGDLCFAEPFGCLDQASATEWSTSVINVFIAATWTQSIRRLTGVGTWLEYLMTKLLIPAKAAEWRKTHLNNSREKTIRRLAHRDRDHADFMYQILNNHSKNPLSQTETILNMALFTSAGTDTTATALTGWTYYVCTHPDVYIRLLPYLDATIHEALRLFPPSPASQQRIVPPGGATIDGYHIPAGTTVAVAPWASTHSRLNFHEPDKFRPERWLGGSNYSNDNLTASLPFVTRPRVCIGRNLAALEMRLISSHLLWSFDIGLDRGRYEEKNKVWGLDGKMRPMRVFHSMTKPELWLRVKEVQR
ncbi:cytochrome P450 [Usnea florida]